MTNRTPNRTTPPTQFSGTGPSTDPSTIEHDSREGVVGSGVGIQSRQEVDRAVAYRASDREALLGAAAKRIAALRDRMRLALVRLSFQTGAEIERVRPHMRTKADLEDWLRNKCGIAKSTGYEYLRIYETFAGREWLLDDLTVTQARKLSRSKARTLLNDMPIERPDGWDDTSLAELVDAAERRAGGRRKADRNGKHPASARRQGRLLAAVTPTMSIGSTDGRDVEARISLGRGPYNPAHFAKWLVASAGNDADTLLVWFQDMNRADIERRLRFRIGTTGVGG